MVPAMRLALAALALVVAAGPGWAVSANLNCLPGKICHLTVPTIGCDEYIDALQVQSAMAKGGNDASATDAVVSLINAKKCVLIPAGSYIQMLPGDRLEFTLSNSGHLLYLAYSDGLFSD